MPRYKEPFSLYSRKMRDKKKVWYYRTYNEDGVRTSGISTSQTSKTKARLYCLELMKRGKLIPEKDIYFANYAENWWIWDKCLYVKAKLLRSQQGKPLITQAYVRDQRNRMSTYLLPEFGHLRLPNITSARIEKWLFRISDEKKLSHSTLNHMLNCLNIMLAEAKRFGYIHKNPCEIIKPLAGCNKTRGILTLDEVKKIFADHALEEVWNNDLLFYTINMLAATTGIRQGSIRGIQEAEYFGHYVHVAHSYGEFGLGPTKNKEEIDVPIPVKVQNYMNRLIGKGGFIFSLDANGETPVTGEKIREALYAAFKKIGITDEARKKRNIDFHSWRHFFNTYCRRLNIPDAKIQKVTGHKSIAMVENYTHFELGDYQEITKAQEQLLG